MQNSREVRGPSDGQKSKPRAYQVEAVNDVDHEKIALDYAIYNDKVKGKQGAPSVKSNQTHNHSKSQQRDYEVQFNTVADNSNSARERIQQEVNKQEPVSEAKERKAQPKHKHSESYRALIDSKAIQNSIELCEAFVIVGVHHETLKLHLKQVEEGDRPHDDYSHQNALLGGMDTSMEKSSPFANNDSFMSSTPQILDTYPKIQRDYQDFPAVLNTSKNQNQNSLLSSIKEQYLYLSNIQLICFPEGYYVDVDFNESKLKNLCGQQLTASGYHTLNHVNLSKCKLQHFTITQSSGEKKYLTSISYYELALVEYESDHLMNRKLVILPKCLCLVSRLPLFSIQKQMLEFMHEDLVQRFHLAFYEDYIKAGSKIEEDSDFGRVMDIYERVKERVKLEKLEFYLSTFFHHLKIDGTNLEIEIYKKSAGLNSSSSNTRDKQHKKTLLRFVNTFNKECLRLENYDYRLLFQKVPPNTLMQMFVSLLHERKIILIHNDSSKNAILIETLISLLYPLQWNFTNISYLIPSMVEYLEAPFPYIVGVPRDLWKYIYEQKWDILGEEVVAFDIDNHRIFNKEELPEFPQPYTSMLIEQLKKQIENGKKISSKLQNLSLSDIQREEDKFWNHFTLKVKQQFVNFLIFVINNFESFYETAKKQDGSTCNGGSGGLVHAESLLMQAQSTLDSSRINQANSSGVQVNDQCTSVKNQFGGMGSANDIFNFDEYIENFKDNQSFFEKFLRTQAFINFIEQAYYEEQGNLSDASIRFFKECTRKLSSENLQALRAMQDSMIQGLIHKFNERGISYSIDKCHMIYEKSLANANLKTKDPQQEEHLSPHFGLFQRLNHSRIIQMKQFDPTPLIEQRFTKGQETLFDVQNLQQQRRQSIKGEGKLKLPQNSQHLEQESTSVNYRDNLAIFIQGSEETAGGNALGIGASRLHLGERVHQFGTNETGSALLEGFHQPSFNTNNVPDYFTVQATPINGQSRVNLYLELDHNKEALNNTTNLIKIEDNYDGQDFDESRMLPQHDRSHHDEEEGSGSEEGEGKGNEGFLGFFKKTFSSVKKTFESTFNANNINGKQDQKQGKYLKSKSQQRPAAQSSYSQQRPTGLFGFMTGSNTPDLIVDESKHGDGLSKINQESPEIIGSRRKVANQENNQQQKAQNRAARSQTFHTKVGKGEINKSKEDDMLGLMSLIGIKNTDKNANKEVKRRNSSRESRDNAGVAVRQETKNSEKRNSRGNEKEVKRDRKANNSFFASLWNLGSSRKNKLDDLSSETRQIQSLSPHKELPPSQAQLREKIVLTKKNRNRTLNGSGFFVFNEEDMKNMTEMSPTNLFKQNSAQVEIKVFRQFDFQQVESQLSHRQHQHQPPLIKNPPILDQQQNSLLSRLRSISHQTQPQSRYLTSNNNSTQKDKARAGYSQSKFAAKEEKKADLGGNSNNNNIGGVTMYHNYQSTLLDNKQTQQHSANRQTFAANSQGFSPIQMADSIDSRNNHDQNFRERPAPQQLIFNLEDELMPLQDIGYSLQQTPKYQTQLSAKYCHQRESKVATDKNEFEQIYKQSTEKLLYPPVVIPLNNQTAAAAAPTLSKTSSKEKFTMWKSQTSKINIKSLGVSAHGSAGGSQSGIAHYSYTLNSSLNSKAKPHAQKPPKHHYKIIKKNSVSSNGKANNKSALHNSNVLNTSIVSNSCKNGKQQVPSQSKRGEDILALQRSLTSELCNDRNSTDEDVRAPILGKNLAQFQNIMQNSSKPFDKMNSSSQQINTTQTIKLDYDEPKQTNKKQPRQSKEANQVANPSTYSQQVVAPPTVTNFSLLNKGSSNKQSQASSAHQKVQQQLSHVHSKHLSYQVQGAATSHGAHSKQMSQGGIMQSIGLNSSSQPKLKSQASSSKNSVQIAGESSVQSPLIENIEPDEDCQKAKQFNKQIESMQLGRVRKKSSNKSSMHQHAQNRSNHGGGQSTGYTRKNSSIQLLNQSAAPIQQNQYQHTLTKGPSQLITSLNNTHAQTKLSSNQTSNTAKRVQKQVTAAKISNFINQSSSASANPPLFNDTNKQLQDVLREMNLKDKERERLSYSKGKSQPKSNQKTSQKINLNSHTQSQARLGQAQRAVGETNINGGNQTGSRNHQNGLSVQARAVASAEGESLRVKINQQSRTLMQDDGCGEDFEVMRIQHREGGASKMSQSRQNASLPVKTIQSSDEENEAEEDEDIGMDSKLLNNESPDEEDGERENYRQRGDDEAIQSSSIKKGRPQSQNSFFASSSQVLALSQPKKKAGFLNQEASFEDSQIKTVERRTHLNPPPLRSIAHRHPKFGSEEDSPVHSHSSFSRSSKKGIYQNAQASRGSEEFNSDDLDGQEIQDEDFIESKTNQQNSSSYINAINQSIDFRDSKRRDISRVMKIELSQEKESAREDLNVKYSNGAGVISPTHQIKKINQQSLGGQMSANIVEKDSLSLKMSQGYQDQISIAGKQKTNMRSSMQGTLNQENSQKVNGLAVGRQHSHSQHTKIDVNQQNKRPTSILQSEFKHSLSPKQKFQIDQKIPSPTNTLHQRNGLEMQRAQMPNSQPQSRLQTVSQQQPSQKSNFRQQNLHRHNPSEQPSQHLQPLSHNPVPQAYFTNMNQQTPLNGGQHRNAFNNHSNNQNLTPQVNARAVGLGDSSFPHHNTQKPLNKMTLDAFSQIAKLSGDVDHEPHTPKSGGKNKSRHKQNFQNINLGAQGRLNTTEEIESMSDCEDIY